MQKGNVIIGQSGGPTAVINASLLGVFEAAKEANIEKIYGMHHGIEGFLKGNFFDLEDYIKTKEDAEILKQTPSAALGSCRYKLPDKEKNISVYQEIFKKLEGLSIRYFIYIGGNDSMDTILKLSQYAEEIKSEIRFIGVPKTIDNDLSVTDHTPGYGSAAKYVATSMKEIIRDSSVYDMKSVTIVEIMGRNAGWLTAAAALSKGKDCPGPDCIYLPEAAFDEEEFIKKVESLLTIKNTVVIAVSESLKNKNGEHFGSDSTAKEDSFGHKILSGTALALSDLVHEKLGVKARGIIFNTLQRAATHIASKTDIEEALSAGKKALIAAISGETGKMIIFERISNTPYKIELKSYDIKQIANEEKVVPQNWMNEDKTFVTDAFVEYAKPLIVGEITPIMQEGLPLHFKISEN